MHKKIQLPVSLLILICVIAISIVNFRCGQIGMPVGGPRDTLPPVLKSADPENHSVHFKARNITLSFDEYVQLDNPMKNIVVSPLPKKTPFFDYKLKTVSIKLYDTLQPATTYSIQFGDAIRDINENNILKNFTYVFSTGNYVDSLRLNGSIYDAESGTIDSTLTVLLYTNLADSAVLKQKPKYIAKADGQGKFAFGYLPPGQYHIYALKDESGLFMYNNPSQLFAFRDSVIDLKGEGYAPITLYAYQQEVPVVKPSSGGKVAPELKYTTSISEGRQDLLKPLVLTFNHPLQSFDTSKIFLADTLNKKITAGVQFSLDTTSKVLSIAFQWPEARKLQLVLLPDGVKDTLNKTISKADTLKFETQSETAYGSIKMTFKNLSKYQNPVLQLISDKKELTSYPLTSNIFERKMMYPGEYIIQILEDKNRNGKWDSGNYTRKIQPEIVHRLSQKLAIRANWENELDIQL